VRGDVIAALSNCSFTADTQPVNANADTAAKRPTRSDGARINRFKLNGETSDTSF
jgi:outer membrane biogenesis lipoprotein LolB